MHPNWRVKPTVNRTPSIKSQYLFSHDNSQICVLRFRGRSRTLDPGLIQGGKGEAWHLFVLRVCDYFCVRKTNGNSTHSLRSGDVSHVTSPWPSLKHVQGSSQQTFTVMPLCYVQMVKHVFESYVFGKSCEGVIPGQYRFRLQLRHLYFKCSSMVSNMVYSS